MATTRVLYFNIFIVALHSLHGIARGDYEPFDYFKFVLEWPPAVCNHVSGRTCKMSPLPNDFTIHGLWPDVFSGSFPLNCPGPNYELIEDDELLTALNRYWPNFVYGEVDNQLTWGYQWRRHGTCTCLWFFQLSYFDLAVEMKEQFNVLGHLQANGIVPGASYVPSNIRTVIQWLTGKVPSLACTYDQLGRDQLTEIRLCYDRNGTIIDCLPGRSTTSCNHDYILFPAA